MLFIYVNSESNVFHFRMASSALFRFYSCLNFLLGTSILHFQFRFSLYLQLYFSFFFPSVLTLIPSINHWRCYFRLLSLISYSRLHNYTFQMTIHILTVIFIMQQTLESILDFSIKFDDLLFDVNKSWFLSLNHFLSLLKSNSIR